MRAYHVCIFSHPCLAWPDLESLICHNFTQAIVHCFAKVFILKTLNEEKTCYTVRSLPNLSFLATGEEQLSCSSEPEIGWYIMPQRASPFIFGRSLYVMPLDKLALLAPCLKENPCHAMILFIDWYDVESSSLRFTNHNFPFLP